MKKNLIASLSLIAVFASATSAAILAHPVQAAQPVRSTGPAAPAIQDPELLDAWTRLYSHTDPIALWDGTTTSGRALAEYLAGHAIPVVWGTAQDCGGYSCSVKRCTPDGSRCTYDTGRPGVAPIYIRAGEHGDPLALTDTLAHEIFHRTQPFGRVGDTRFEEYWAFRIEYHIHAEPWLTFGSYDPLDANHLSMWIRANKFNDYLSLPAYPASVAALVAAGSGQGSAAASSNPSGQPAGID